MKILCVERHTSVHGGGELVAAWILEALKDEHELTVYGWSRPDFALQNRFYGTSLSNEQIGFEGPPRPIAAAFRLAGGEHLDAVSFQRFATMMRFARKVVPRYDLAISPLDEFDFGAPGLQYVHYPWLPLALGTTPVPRQVSARRPWMWTSGVSVERIRANGTAANSQYTAGALRDQIGIEAAVIHPPCPGEFPARAWEDRADSVVMIGRLIPHKRFDLAVEVIRQVRAEAGDVRLVVIGNARGVDRRSQREVRGILSSEPWIELREEVPRAELGRVASESRYGIHPMDDEPWGIAVAEMVRAGCIPLTSRGGGPPEITGDDERLRFDSVAEGAERLLALMRSPQDRDEIRERLSRRAAALRPEEFVRRIRDWVDSAAPASSGGPPA